MVTYIPYVILVGISKGTVITAGYRDAKIITQTAVGIRTCTFTKVLYMLDLSANLLSIESLRKKGVFYRSDR